MNIGGRAVAKALVRPFIIVQIEVSAQAGEQSGYIGVFLDVNVLVLYRSPKAFNEDIVEDATTAVHTNTNIRRFQLVGESVCREMNPGSVIEGRGWRSKFPQIFGGCW